MNREVPKAQGQGESLFAPGEQETRSKTLDEMARAKAPYGGMPEQPPLDARAVRVGILGAVAAAVFVLAQFTPDSVATLTLADGFALGLPTLAGLVSAVQDRAAQVFAFVALADGGTYFERLSVYIVLALTGAGLALSGAAYQGAFRNALAAPSTMGVMSGASLGCCLFYALTTTSEGWPMFMGRALSPDSTGFDWLWLNFGDSLWAFAGAMAVVGIVMLVSMRSRRSRASRVYVIIAGQVVAAICSGVMTAIRSYFAVVEPWGGRVLLIAQAQAATFGGAFGLVPLLCIAVPLVLVMVLLLANSRKLTLLSFDDEEVSSMGVATGKLRVGVIVACTFLTAVIVAFCGPIGFLGFFMPHLARRLVGPGFKYLLPASMLLGATFCVAAYALMGFFSATSYVGLFISTVGGVAFLVVALRERGRVHGDWL